MSYPVKVKWGKETIELNIIPADGVQAFKTALEERTGVPCDRMKLMPKTKGLWKGVLKDDANLALIDFPAALSKSNPLQILLMGSATKLVAPKTKTIFIEDLPPEEAAKHAPEPSGLINLGNTCYLNSVLQCLRAIPQLRQGLQKYNFSSSTNSANVSVLTALRDLYSNLDRSASALPPSQFVMLSKMRFPQFAQTGPQGQPMQQDAEEFYSGLLTVGAEEMRGGEGVGSGFDTQSGTEGVDNLMDAIFGMKVEETQVCDETTTTMDVDGEAVAAAEAPKGDVRYDSMRKLVCNIQGGSDDASTVNVRYIQEGLNLALTGKIEKYSDELQRNAMWTRTQRLARLPPILVVQFGRFYWKATPDSQDHAGVKCKVMKPVAFNDTLDMYEFCNEGVKKVLKVHRDKAAKEEEDRIAQKLKEGAAGASEEEKKTKTMGDEAMKEFKEKHGEVDDDEEAELKAALAMSMGEEAQPMDEEATVEKQPAVGPGLPDEFQGIYELFAVVTHKGRSADGGHYMGWVKAEEQSSKTKETDTATNKKPGKTKEGVPDEDWFVFDDDEVSPCKTEDVLKLKGGGDWHMSYLNFYRAKK